MPRNPADISDATLKLLLTSDIGPATLKRLRAHFSNDDAIVQASSNELQQIRGIGEEIAGSIRRAMNESDPESERHHMHTAGTNLILIDDDDYPPLLATIHDPPTALWIKGSITGTDKLAVAIVGSRRCTAYGREQSSRFASLLTQSGLTIVSGGAFGVDAEAHRGALRVEGRTIVVAGCGLANVYPREHEDLFNRIADGRGAIVSEFPMTFPPIAKNFPRRNRIISGMSLGVVVIEAPLRSGALITARLAAEEHHREVMALPGRVDSPASAGCLKMIQEGWATLVTNHADVLHQLDSSGQLVRGALEAAGVDGATKAATLFDRSLTNEQTAIIEVLKEANDILLLDQLAARTQLPINQIMTEITLLQIRGRVSRDHRGVRLK